MLEKYPFPEHHAFHSLLSNSQPGYASGKKKDAKKGLSQIVHVLQLLR